MTYREGRSSIAQCGAIGSVESDIQGVLAPIPFERLQTLVSGQLLLNVGRRLKRQLSGTVCTFLE